MIKPIDTTAIRELIAKATPGPWKYDNREECINKEDHAPWEAIFWGGHEKLGAAMSDIDLVLHLVNNASAMVDEINRLREEVEAKDLLIQQKQRGKNGDKDCFICGADDEVCNTEFHGLHGPVRVCDTCFDADSPGEMVKVGAPDAD